MVNTDITGDLILQGSINTLTPIGGKYSQTGGNINISNTTVASTLINSGAGTLTFEPAEWTNGATYHIKISGTIDDDSKLEEVEIKILLGGTEIHTTDFIDLEDITSQKAWELEVDLTYKGGVNFRSNSQFTYLKNGGGNSYKGWARSQSRLLPSIASAMDLTATAQWTNANANNIFIVQMFYVTKVY